MDRISKHEYYANIALAVSLRSTCLRRHYGAVIVKNDRIISTGYNGSPRREPNCSDNGTCNRDLHHCEKGSGYLFCPAVHAEMNAIINASKNDLLDATLYIAGTDLTVSKEDIPPEKSIVFADPRPCSLCRRMIVNSGIGSVIGILPDGSIANIDFKENKNASSGECDISYIIQPSIQNNIFERFSSIIESAKKIMGKKDLMEYLEWIVDRDYADKG